MRGVAEMLMVVVAVLAVVGGGPAAAASVMMQSSSWKDCGTNTSIFRVTKLNVTSPLNIPGDLTIREFEMTLNGTLPADALITFHVESTSSFGPGYNRILPCFENQGGSCGYKLWDMLNLTDSSSRVTKQVVKALMDNGFNPAAGAFNVNLRDVTINVPSMLHTEMDLFVNTNNYFVTTRLVSADLKTEYGCVEIDMPVQKPCQGWLCMQSIDYINKIMNP